MQWFYEKAGAKVGPVSERELAELLLRDEIRIATLVWRQGLDNWRPLNEAAPHLVPDPASRRRAVAPMPAADPLPQVGLGSDPTAGKGFTVKGALERGWRVLFSDRFTALFCAAIVVGILTNAGVLFPCLNFVFILAFTVPMQAGLQYYCLRHLRGENPGFVEIFSGFRRNFVQLVLLNIAFFAAGIAVLIVLSITFVICNADVIFNDTGSPPDPFAIVNGDWYPDLWRWVVPVVVGLLAVAYLHIVFAFATPLVIDKLAGIGEAIKQSVRAAHRYFPRILAIHLACWLVMAIFHSVPVGYLAYFAYQESQGNAAPELQTQFSFEFQYLALRLLLGFVQSVTVLIWVLPILAVYTSIFGYQSRHKR